MGNRLLLIIYLVLAAAGLHAQTPQLTIPSGHSAWISDVAISKNGKYLVTGSFDNTLKLWDYATCRELKTLYGHTDVINAVAIAPQNDVIASASYDGTIKLWDINNGRIRKSISCPRWAISLAFSPNGKFLACSSTDRRVIIYDLVADSIKSENNLDGAGGKVEFFPDGKNFAVIDQMPKGQNNEICLYDVETGDHIPSKSFSYIHGDILDFCISPSGRYIYSIVNTDSANVRVHDMVTHKDVMRVQGHKRQRASVVSGENDSTFYSISFSSYSNAVRKSEIKKWNWKDTLCTDSAIMWGTNPFSDKILFSESTKSLVIPLSSIAYGVIGTVNLHPLNSIKGFTSLINDFHEFADGRFLVNADDGNVKEINTAKGTFDLLLKPKINSGPLTHSVLLPDSNTLILSSPFKKSLSRLDIRTKKRTDIALRDTSIRDLSFDKKNNLLALNMRTNAGSEIAITDTNGVEIAKRVFGDKKRNYMTAFAFLAGKRLALRIAGLDSLIIWDFKADLVTYFGDGSKGRFIWSMAVLDNNRLMEGAREDGKLIIRSIGPEPAENILQAGSASVTAVSIDSATNRMLTTTSDGNIMLWDMGQMAVLKTFSANKSTVLKTAFTKKQDVIYSYGMDNILHFWDTRSGKEIVSVTLLDTIQYAVSMPGGLFDASPAAMKLMYYVVNDSLDKDEPWKIIELDQLKHRYYQPGLLQIRLGYSKEKLREVPLLNTVELAPKIKTGITGNKLLITLKNQKGGIGKVAIYLNDAELIADARPAKTDVKNLQETTITFDLKPYYARMIPGKGSTVKVVAWNGGNWISSKPELAYFTPPPTAKGVTLEANTNDPNIVRPKFYAVVFGTSDYAGKDLDLTYSSKDAIDIANALKLSATNLFGKENVEVDLFNSEEKNETGQPTKRNFIACMAALQKKVKPWDVLIIYFSGHGINYGGADGDFYYLTQQASASDAEYLGDPQVRNTIAISSMELTDLLNKVPANKKILILDACASGKAAATMMAAVRDVPASQVRALDRMRDRTGFYILSGSASDAVSYESPLYGQGLLTYALLKAMRGGALRIDKNEEFVDVNKLLTFAVDEVPVLAAGIGGIQKPLYRSPGDQQSFDIGQVDEQTKKLIVISDPKPVFVAASFQDPVQLFDELLLSEKINALLRENNLKGKQADFMFIDSKDYPGAYRVTGSYQKNGNKLLLRYVLTRDKTRIGDIRTFESPYEDPEVFVTAFLADLKKVLPGK